MATNHSLYTALETEVRHQRLGTGRVTVCTVRGARARGANPYSGREDGAMRRVAELTFDMYRLVECLPLGSGTKAEREVVRRFASAMGVPSSL